MRAWTAAGILALMACTSSANGQDVRFVTDCTSCLSIAFDTIATIGSPADPVLLDASSRVAQAANGDLVFTSRELPGQVAIYDSNGPSGTPAAGPEGLPLIDSGIPSPDVIHAVVPLADDTIAALVEPAPFLRIYALRDRGWVGVRSAGEPGRGEGHLLRPWRAVLLEEGLYVLDTGNYGARGMVTVWNRDLEEVGRFAAMPHTVDLVEACDGRVARVFQAVSGSAAWPAYGLAVRRQGRWAPVGPVRPDTIPLTGSWEDTRAVVTEGQVLLLGLRGLLHRLSCDGATSSAELLAFRSRLRRFLIHRGAAATDSTAVFFWAHPTARQTTRVATAHTSGRHVREYVLEGDYRLHGFSHGVYWVVHLAAGASPHVLGMEPGRFERWLAGS